MFADCPDGARATTEAERARYERTMKAIQGLIPAAPAGWRLDDRNGMTLGGSTCKGSDFTRITYSVQYAYLDGMRAGTDRAEQMRKEIAILRELPADQAAALQSLSQQSRALGRERAKVRASGDAGAIAALESQIRDLNLKAAGIKRAHEEKIQPRIMEITQKFLAEANAVNNFVRVAVEVNWKTPVLRVEGDAQLAAGIRKLFDVEAIRAALGGVS